MLLGSLLKNLILNQFWFFQVVYTWWWIVDCCNSCVVWSVEREFVFSVAMGAVKKTVQVDNSKPFGCKSHMLYLVWSKAIFLSIFLLSCQHGYCFMLLDPLSSSLLDWLLYKLKLISFLCVVVLSSCKLSMPYSQKSWLVLLYGDGMTTQHQQLSWAALFFYPWTDLVIHSHMPPCWCIVVNIQLRNLVVSCIDWLWSSILCSLLCELLSFTTLIIEGGWSSVCGRTNLYGHS